MSSKKIKIFLIILLITLSIVSIFIGAYDINFKELLNGDTDSIDIIVLSRLPRVLAVIITGMGMSIAGLIMQNLYMNKFISPTTGATISSAQLGILISILFFPKANLGVKTIFAFAAALLGTYVFITFMQKIKFKDIVMVPLVGIMFGNIIGGITEYFSYKNNLEQVMTSWLVGDFSLIIKGRYEIVYIVLPLIIIAFIFANHFNIVGMGENFSKNLGINYNFVLFLGLGIVAIITAGIVVTVGSVPYIGLIVPNIVSIYKGDKLKNSLIETGLLGAIFVLFCDILGRIINYPYEIPVSLTVGIIGSIVFIFIIIDRLRPKGAKNVKAK